MLPSPALPAVSASPWPSSLLTLVPWLIISCLRALNITYTLITRKSIPSPPITSWDPDSYVQLSIWISNRHLKLNLTKTEFLFPLIYSSPSLPHRSTWTQLLRTNKQKIGILLKVFLSLTIPPALSIQTCQSAQHSQYISNLTTSPHFHCLRAYGASVMPHPNYCKHLQIPCS